MESRRWGKGMDIESGGEWSLSEGGKAVSLYRWVVEEV